MNHILIASWLIVLFPLVGTHNPNVNQEPSSETTSQTDPFPPVDNMHHFMEYISEPAYKGLKAALATEPENRRAWRPIKSHALILAETSALVADRVPEGASDEQTQQWKQLSREVYNSGKALYGSVGDYAAAKKHYEAMLNNCNRCHQVFADGKYQLEK